MMCRHFFLHPSHVQQRGLSVAWRFDVFIEDQPRGNNGSDDGMGVSR